MTADLDVINTWTNPNPGLRRRTYEQVPRRGGRWRPTWTVDGVTINRPGWDYDRNQFTGVRNNGTAWTADFTPGLLYTIASQVRGWCWPRQGGTLYELAQASTGQVVEIGSCFGLSAVWTGWGIRTSADPDRRLHCVDTWHSLDVRGDGSPAGKSSQPEFIQNMTYTGLAYHTCLHQMLSEQAAATWDEGPVGMIYIDGWHTYAMAKADHLSWLPHLTPGAVVAFDDCSPAWPGVLRYQRELAGRGDHELLGRADSMLTWRYRP